jgi:very-short-patch-repair endonuclease
VRQSERTRELSTAAFDNTWGNIRPSAYPPICWLSRGWISSNSKSAARLALFARQRRSCLTESEARLWSALKAGQLSVCFRRQMLGGDRFIADFCAPSVRLIVEVDGGLSRPPSRSGREPRLQARSPWLSRRSPRRRVGAP